MLMCGFNVNNIMFEYLNANAKNNTAVFETKTMDNRSHICSDFVK